MLSHQSDADIMAIANPIMDNLMAGSTAINHAQHTRDFSERMKAIVTPEHLQYVCQHYQAQWGYFTERELVLSFDGQHRWRLSGNNFAHNKRVNLSPKWC